LRELHFSLVQQSTQAWLRRVADNARLVTSSVKMFCLSELSSLA